MQTAHCTTTLPQLRTFPADESALFGLRGFVRSRAAEASLPDAATQDLLLAVSEACSELLAHERGSNLVVSWWAHDGQVEIRVKNEGVVRIPAEDQADDETIESFQGGPLGFPHLLAFVDEYVVRPATDDHPSTTIRLVKEIGPA